MYSLKRSRAIEDLTNLPDNLSLLPLNILFKICLLQRGVKVVEECITITGVDPLSSVRWVKLLLEPYAYNVYINYIEPAPVDYNNLQNNVDNRNVSYFYRSSSPQTIFSETDSDYVSDMEERMIENRNFNASSGSFLGVMSILSSENVELRNSDLICLHFIGDEKTFNVIIDMDPLVRPQ
jgi:hypothetical protein